MPTVVSPSERGCVGAEVEEVAEALLGGVGVRDDALRARPAFLAGEVEQDGFLDAGESGVKKWGVAPG